MTLRYDKVTARSEEDVARLYVAARVAGLEVTHSDSKACFNYDGSPASRCQLGVFRHVGDLIFYKDERRWEVRAAVDCGPVDLATLIEAGLDAVDEHGRSPGHYTRRRHFRHEVSERTGKRICFAGVSYRLTADDLLQEATATTASLDVESFTFGADNLVDPSLGAEVNQ